MKVLNEYEIEKNSVLWRADKSLINVHYAVEIRLLTAAVQLCLWDLSRSVFLWFEFDA